jgi:hypothetical protein
VIDELIARIVIFGDGAVPEILIAGVAVTVDQSGNHRFARQIDANGIDGWRPFSAASDPCESATFDEQCSVLDGSTAVANDQAGAFEPDGGIRRRLRARRSRREQETAAEGHDSLIHVEQARCRNKARSLDDTAAAVARCKHALQRARWFANFRLQPNPQAPHREPTGLNGVGPCRAP